MREHASREPTSNERLDALASEYRAPLIRWFIRKGADREIAEDLAHEVFVRVSKNNLDGVTRPEAYLFATASSVLIDRSRRLKARHADEHDPIDNFEIESVVPSVTRVIEGKEALMRLAVVLDQLPERTREIFLLSRLDRLSNTQLAARYGISVSSIEKHMKKALAHLRKRFL
ncbi:MAG: subfamily polymerase sigma-24 factor [Bradyrhizobium sp.]|nr:subfamily polymerase sigma-24 factor [Bradyrhizobium sp.]